LARPAATAGDDELVDEVLRALGDLEDVRLGFRIEVSIARTEAAHADDGHRRRLAPVDGWDQRPEESGVVVEALGSGQGDVDAAKLAADVVEPVGDIRLEELFEADEVGDLLTE
jgi:hypothetical protein